MPRPKDAAYRIEPLGKDHDRSVFSCGAFPLDRYLKEPAGQDARKRVAATFALCEGKSDRVLGYYTLSAFSIDVGAWPETVARKLPKCPLIPTTLLGGEYLLMDALRRSLDASSEVALMAIVVDAKDDKAVSFYRRHGFISFAGQENRLFLPMAVIERLFG